MYFLSTEINLVNGSQPPTPAYRILVCLENRETSKMWAVGHGVVRYDERGYGDNEADWEASIVRPFSSLTLFLVLEKNEVSGEDRKWGASQAPESRRR